MVTTKRENIIDPALFSDMNKRIESAKESVEQNVEWAEGVSGEFSANSLIGYVKELVIPEGAESIPFNGFTGKTNLEKVVVPGTVITIGASAFGGCSNLKIIVLSEGVETLTASWGAATGIADLTIPTTVKNVPSGCFVSMSNLKTVYFKGVPNTIDSGAFPNDSAVTDIYVPWSEGEVANAPWGATNATIHYNYTG